MAKQRTTRSKTAPDTKAAALANAEASQNKAAEASAASSTSEPSTSKPAAKSQTASRSSKAPNAVKTSLNSAVTTDLPATTGSASTAELSEADEAALDAVNNDPMQRAMDAGIGLIKPLGIDFDYVGVTPSRDKDPKTPDGLPIAASRATFTALANVPFAPSTRVKDPSSGEFYYPPDGCTSWEGCEYKGNPLIPKTADKAAAKARRQARLDAVGRG
jgi:hypothetical protein